MQREGLRHSLIRRAAPGDPDPKAPIDLLRLEPLPFRRQTRRQNPMQREEARNTAHR
jgi:hypothetical protein